MINASLWDQIKCGTSDIYSPNKNLLTSIKQPNLAHFWKKTYTSFACVIYDTINLTITAIRDHCGIEPLYYSYSNGRFIFGSSIPDMLRYISPQINMAQIQQLFINKWLYSETYSNETYYKNIYRLEPGCELFIDCNKPNSHPIQRKYWDLSVYTQNIYYADTRDYDVHFTALFNESLAGIAGDIAVEFSGGLDSAAIVAAAVNNNISPSLYMHVATGNITDEARAASSLINQLSIEKVHYIDAKHFDLVSTMQEYAQYFAGGAPYNGVVFASNIHQAIVKKGHKIVLSGIGGDECVSSHAPMNVCLKQMRQEYGWQAMWDYFSANKGKSPQSILRCLRLLAAKSHNTLREYEYNLLQGPGSHHIRLRIEYNAIVAKALGYNYVYPLLYPPLVEFCYQLPLEQKRRNTTSRYLMRKYLSQFLLDYNYKTKSGCVTPATFAKTQALYQAGIYQNIFQDLPFLQKSTHNPISKKYPFMQAIPAYMFDSYDNKKVNMGDNTFLNGLNSVQ